MLEFFAKEKKKVTIGAGSIAFEVLLWVFFIIPGIIFMFMKKKAKKYLNELKTQIDDCYALLNNILNQRIDTLNEVDRFAKWPFSEISKDLPINEKGSLIEKASREAKKLIDKNLELKTQIEINNNLKRELVSVKSNYNNLVLRWNKELFLWPTKQIVAAKEGYTTEVTYTVLDELKVNAKGGLLE
ncbi:MAG: hypothetical protein J6T15_03225 [Bacilli bacterium]|nr:hypothetical protein [Bacilli bacterium]